MEILKGFSFNIQLFALTGAQNLTIVGSNGNDPSSEDVVELQDPGESKYFLNATTGEVSKDPAEDTGLTLIATVAREDGEDDSVFAWAPNITPEIAAGFTAQLSYTPQAKACAKTAANVVYHSGSATFTVTAGNSSVEVSTAGVVTFNEGYELQGSEKFTVNDGNLNLGVAVAADFAAGADISDAVTYAKGVDFGANGVAVTTVPEDANVVVTVKEVTKQQGIKSYRTVINTGKEAGQEVFHLHIHILSGDIKF